MDVDTDNDGDCVDAGGSKRYFYCQDANYNVVALREGSNIVERYEYDPYGNVRIFKGYDSAEGHEDLTVVSDSVAENPILFAGYYFDNEMGLYYVRHRMYSSGLQRWLQRDPLGYVDGQSQYEYVQSEPVTGLDAMGTFDWPVPWYCGKWEDIPGDSKAFREVVKHKRCGFHYWRDPAGKWQEEWACVEIDYEYHSYIEIQIGIAGSNDVGILFSIIMGIWYVPSVNDVLQGINPETGRYVNLFNRLCRKKERCCRECRRCCAWANADTGETGVDYETKKFCGKEYVRYGRLRTGPLKGEYWCELFPPGTLIRNQYGKIILQQPKPLKCTDENTPSCASQN